MPNTLRAVSTHNRATFRAVVDEVVVPYAEECDRAQRIPTTTLRRVGRHGWWGAVLPASVGGAGMDMVTLGELHEEVGRGCSSLRSLLTVHTMVTAMAHRWGSPEMARRWLPRMASGAALGSFCVTEPEVGSDAAAVQTTAVRRGDEFVLDGIKTWITGGTAADLLLVLARTERGPTAFLVEANAAGVERTPITDILGTRASMLAEIRFRGCRVPADAVVGREGAGLLVATTALDLGRYSVAAGSVGILHACLEASVAHTARRSQGGKLLREHQLVRRAISDMVAKLSAARLLVRHAGELKDLGDPATVMATCVAKYVASTSAMRVASDAVQLHGASGCGAGSPVARYLRDAKIMEIIEGSNEIQQLTIAEDAYRQGGDRLAATAFGGRAA